MSQRVLIVDDSEDVRRIIGLRLHNAGFEVGGAADGVEALQALRAERWDLVLLDLMMPRMDGFEFLGEFRGFPGSRPPVVVITQRDDLESRQRALALGAVQYVPKGDVMGQEFVAVVRRWLPSAAPDSNPQ